MCYQVNLLQLSVKYLYDLILIIGITDNIYDWPNNETFCNWIEKIQYNATRAMTAPIKRVSEIKIFKGFGLEWVTKIEKRV